MAVRPWMARNSFKSSIKASESAERQATHLVFVTLDRDGTLAATPPVPGLLASYIAYSAVYKKTSDVLSDPFTKGGWHFVVYFGVMVKCGGEHGRYMVSGIGKIGRR
ncbi:hypothetical protein LZ31DRAFT_595857 [Colletotrichum somersetense]|nr:hypothetical protein LZ31DRAFT_595857 [Colletotrichum somersetense]